MLDVITKAGILTEALPYIKKFSGITVVIKYGGAALVNEDIKTTLIKDIALMKYVGFKPVVVHGGGKDINKALEAVGIEPKFKDGLRVTDEPTMEIVQQVLAGKINKNITTELCMHGINAVGICGKDAGGSTDRIRNGGASGGRTPFWQCRESRCSVRQQCPAEDVSGMGSSEAGQCGD